MSVANS